MLFSFLLYLSFGGLVTFYILDSLVQGGTLTMHGSFSTYGTLCFFDSFLVFDTIKSADTIISITHDSFDEVDTFRWRDSFPIHGTF